MEKVHAELVDVLERIKLTRVPMRSDGMVDLSNYKGFAEQVGFKNLGQMIRIQMVVNDQSKEILLRKAIQNKRNEITHEFMCRFIEEGLTIHDAISLLEETKTLIFNSRINL